MLLKPRVSEKAIGTAEAGVYVFEVPMTANKITVAEAVEKTFKVKVESVNISILKGKARTFRRIAGREKDVKKAIVKLVKGQTIKLFEAGK